MLKYDSSNRIGATQITYVRTTNIEAKKIRPQKFPDHLRVDRF
jgi:hypothetical protein